MRFIKLVLISVIVFGCMAFLISLVFPSTAVVERTGVIQAPIDTVYAHVSNLKAWGQWNPWTRPDTTATLVFSDPSYGAGASYSWSGKENSGKVTILDSEPEKGVHYLMDIKNIRPVHGGIELKRTADGKATAIFWHMEIKLGLLPWWKLRGFMADRIYGPAMDSSLTKLSRICEGK
ncbi:SRPBCC family protein [Chitinophaga sp. 30R24]|uniref:SRPBCC family protein n=1 Tax=Chitinophaga sp. 30R24 TaxID=3248838 RepID=UPI003B8FF45A